MAKAPASIFEQLRSRVDAEVEEEKAKAAIERERKQYERAQARLAELVDSNSTLPCTINSIHVLNALKTRRGFLQRIFDPLLKANNERPFTLAEALQKVHEAADKLDKFDVFEPPITPYIDRPSPSDAASTPTDVNIFFPLKEKSRILLATGTDVGNTEGSAYGNLLYRNLFGGAEKLSLNVAYGTRTRSSYQGIFDTPILSKPDLRLELGSIASSTQNTWASHTEVLKGGWGKLKWGSGATHRHELSYNGSWRQVTDLAGSASPTVRIDAGDSVKSSVSHSWIGDWRDNPLLPSYGLYAKSMNEVAGYGPLRGDASFWKAQFETQGVIPIPLPRVKNSGITFTTGLRGGLLYPLIPASGGSPRESRISDRFLLGGPTDVRGFRLAGLGPRDGVDAVGGDVYAAGSANLLFPLPGVGPSRPLRAQLFINGGRLLSLKRAETLEGEKRNNSTVSERIQSTIAELGNGLPSTAAGFGVVYAHPIARFELNFSLPLVMRKDEDARKGLQFGIGINFM